MYFRLYNFKQSCSVTPAIKICRGRGTEIMHEVRAVAGGFSPSTININEL